MAADGGAFPSGSERAVVARVLYAHYRLSGGCRRTRQARLLAALCFWVGRLLGSLRVWPRTASASDLELTVSAP